ncbi:MAG TPA: hypothetical protein VFD13_04730 [Candidatus Kapabacteria bacterium]|nr:hypothetical protein [Candidatus Kapabacteria bacterium]
MTATFRLKPGELNEDFFAQLKAMFDDREVEIVVYDVTSESEENSATLKSLDHLK